MTVLGWTITGDALIVGALSGLAYAVLAAGLVLVYRATRVINFAHGEIGAFGAAVLAKAVLDWGWNFFVALAAVLVAGGALGAMVELTVVRRLFRAPRLTLLVATIGVSQLVFVMQILLPGIDEPGRYPSPFRGEVELGNIVLRSEHFMVMLFVPAVIAGLGYLLTRTRYGIDIRAAAENPDRAEMLGIDIHRVSTIVWVLAGVLATLTAVLINPMRGTIVGIPSMALGPGLLLRALAAALFGRISSLPRALLGGLIVGVVEAVMYVNVANPGAVDALLFVMVLGTVVFVGDRGAEEDSGGWSLMPKVRAAPERLRNVWWIRRMAWVMAAAGLLVAVAAPMVFTKSADIFMLSRVLIYALVAVSVTVLTGWSGQLSLGQFAFVGVGAMITASLVARGMPFGAALAYSTVAGVVVAVVVGFPALRVRGLHLAVTTLAFAVASRGYFLAHPLFLGDRAAVLIPRFTWLGIDFSSQRAYYYLCLVALVATTFIVSRIRATGVGRSMIAVRDNEAAAASFTISPSISKLTAFAVSGGCAALAGALLGGLQSQFGPAAFPPDESLRVVAMTVIGGLGSIGGALLGALYVVGIPALFDDNVTVGLLTSAIGLLVLLLYLPGGLAGLAFRARDALLAMVDARLPAAPHASADVSHKRGVLPATARRDRAEDSPALRATNISLAFGGVRALDSVSIEARQGEVVGLIGSNGAGKSTLMNVISGYARADTGSVELFGEDVTILPPHLRARRGVGRVFQDARLFGDLTLEETVKVALEAHERSEFVPSVLALAPSRRAERAKAALAKDYIAFLGLGAHAGSFLSELSTGTRRIVELCCLLAQRPDLLLLDEPTAGVAQREAEAFGPLIKMIQAELHATVVIIEHDLPLVMGMSDRVYCLAAGTQIAEGLPGDVRSNPAVIAAYLGTDERAIQRSGAGTGAGTTAAGKRVPRTKPLEAAR